MSKLSAPIFMKGLPALTGSLAIAYFGLCIFLRFWQTRMIFFPSPVVETTPADFGLPHQEVWLAVGAQRLHGWWLPAAIATNPTLLYLHGNGLNIGANVNQARRFHQLGFSVLLIDYRGYGRSGGSFPSEASVYQDAEAAWTYLTQTRGIAPEAIFLYGHSLGGAIAIELATRHPELAGLIVEGSFTSIRDMVDHVGQYQLFPVDLLLTQHFDSLTKVRSLQPPILFIHGTADSVIPAQMSQTLYTAAASPKQLLLVPGAGHSDAAEVGGSKYLQAIQSFIQQAMSNRDSSFADAEF